MKKQILTALLLLCTTLAFSQDENEDNSVDDQKGKFRKENIFIGGGVNLGFGNRTFTVGLIPEVGYSITKWLDAGVVFNLNYQSENDIYVNGTGPISIRNFNYGAGTFIRIWPVNFLNIAVQPEYNWIKSRQELEPTGEKYTYTFKSESILAGIGYGSREIGGQQTYFNIMFDLLRNINSPYRDQYNNARPVIRTGFLFYLGRKGRR